MSLFQDLRKAAENRAKYRRTLRELESLSEVEARDVGITPDNVRRIAYHAVYG